MNFSKPLFTLLVLCSFVNLACDDFHIETELSNGLVLSGMVAQDSSIHTYLGIPFADPPVDDKRWTAPIPPEPWTGVWAADTMPPACIQDTPGSRLPWTEEFMHQGEISEDCLYLNLWTEAESPKMRRPVMVYLYGGGFSEGSNAVAVYDGEALAKKGVVVVVINYRVGPLGFMAHPELTAESKNKASGNYGLLDQIAALEWVHENISAFGGDPRNVTIFGQSAGGMPVAHLLESPLAEGLFHRAIIQSGPGLFPMPLQGPRMTLAQAEETGRRLADTLGVSSLEEMRSLDPDLLAVAGLGRYGPIADGHFLLAKNTHLNVVPLMNGFTADESRLFGGFAPPRDYILGSFRKDAHASFDLEANTFFRLYSASSDSAVAIVHRDGGRDRGRVAVNEWAQKWTDLGGSAYTYYFSRALPWPEHPEFGAFHTSEVPYVFNNLEFVEKPIESIDLEIADQISDYWVNFAKSGDPNDGFAPSWPAVQENPNQIMNLGSEMGSIELASGDKAEFWRSVLRASGN